MPSYPHVVPGPPLKSFSNGMPLLYGVLAADFYLESLNPDDVARLKTAIQVIGDWIGSQLRWTGASPIQGVRPFRLEDLELISCHPLQLQNELTGTLARLRAAPVAEFEMASHSGVNETDAAPYSLRFYCWITDPDAQPTFENRTILRVTVPTLWPLRDFHDRACALAEILRVRWGSAGLGYSGWEYYQRNSTQKAIYAHARRFPGYDTGYYHRQMLEWHDALRTVNWLTFLGPSFAAALAAKGQLLRSTRLVQVTSVGANLMLRAGDVPEAGDINRLNLPRAYMEADEMVRPVRARACSSFGVPWTEQSTYQWLQRFEKQLRP